MIQGIVEVIDGEKLVGIRDRVPPRTIFAECVTCAGYDRWGMK